MQMATNDNAPNFADLLNRAMTEPGKVHQAYFAFHGYSIGNQMRALEQCYARGIEPGPLACFNRWKELGRHVRKGRKAIEVCMPVTSKRTIPTTDEAGNPTTEDVTFRRFIFRKNWFVLSQTEGPPYSAPSMPEWSKATALAGLKATEIPFDMLDGNCQGYARPHQRAVAVSPIAFAPMRTLFHELAHVLMHDEAEHRDDDRTPRATKEIEAEGVALLCCAALGLPGFEHSAGYLQHWKAQGGTLSEGSARKIFTTADAILRAGKEHTSDGSETSVVDQDNDQTDR
jgi:antirestriction protein ArdC